MGPIDRADFILAFWKDVSSRIVDASAGDLDERQSTLVRRVVARLALDLDEDTIDIFPLWDAQPILTAALIELQGAEETTLAEARQLAHKYAVQMGPHLAGAAKNERSRKELATFCEDVNDEALAAFEASPVGGGGDEAEEPFLLPDDSSANVAVEGASVDEGFLDGLGDEPTAGSEAEALSFDAAAGEELEPPSSFFGSEEEAPAAEAFDFEGAQTIDEEPPTARVEVPAAAGDDSDSLVNQAMDAIGEDDEPFLPPDSSPNVAATAGAGGFDDLLMGGDAEMPDLLAGGDMPDLLGEAPVDMPDLLADEGAPPAFEAEPGADDDDLEVPVDLMNLDLSKTGEMDPEAMARLLGASEEEAEGGEAPGESADEATLASLQHELDDLEAFVASDVHSFADAPAGGGIDDSFLPPEIDDQFLPADDAAIGGLAMAGAAPSAAPEQRAAHEAQAQGKGRVGSENIENLSFEDQIRARMLLISEAVEELAEGDASKQVVDHLVEHFRAISRPITRSGYRTFASLADVLVTTLEYLRQHPVEAPPSLCNNLRELVMTLSEIVDGRWSKYRTFYWLINKLNATQREMEEEVERLEEQRFGAGGSAADDLLAEQEMELEERPSRAELDPSLERAELTELQEIFVTEATEHIDLISRNLLLAEKNPADQEIIYTLMRSAHSIKGSANISKFPHIAGLAHVMEDVMVAIRDNGLAMTPSIIDLLLASVDQLSSMLSGVEYNKTYDEKTVDKLKGQLKALGEELQTHPDRYKASAEAVDSQLQRKLNLEVKKKAEDDKSSQQSEAQREATTVRVDIEDLNLLRNLAAELVINRTRLSGQLEALRGILDGYEREKKLLSNILHRLDNAIEEIAGRLSELFSSQAELAAMGGAGKATGAMVGLASRMAVLESSMRRLLRVRESSMLSGEFAETEFDRFSELDIVWRDLREGVTHLNDLGNHFESTTNDLDQNISRISNIANDLHEQIMRVRMIPIGRVFNRFPRTVRDTSRRLGKKIELAIRGEETPLDKMIIEEIGDPMVHLVRNAIDHGIESPEEREELGKSDTGTLTLEARQEGNQVVIVIRDDGRGIDIEAIKRKAIERNILSEDAAQRASDSELINLIFAPGFSTAKATTDISGRGVGMDVVKTAITKLKGTVTVASELGEGTQFTIRLPVTLAISQALLFAASGSRFAIPLSTVDEAYMIREDQLMRTMGNEVVKLRKDILPVVRLNNVLALGAPEVAQQEERPLIVVNTGDRRIAVLVDRLLGREEIVVKSLGSHLKKLPFVSGGTILGDGDVTLILDIFSIVEQAKPIRGQEISMAIGSEAPGASTFDASQYEDMIESAREKVSAAAASLAEGGGDAPAAATPSKPAAAAAGGRNHILVVDDSISIRRFVGSILENAGYHVTLANDGVDALEKLKAGRYDLILTDLEMPRMHGYELIAEVKQSIAFKSIPIIILTGRAGEKHSRKGMELGASAFLVKPFNEQELLSEITKNIGAHPAS